MIATISTYSAVDCPLRWRVNLGDTPPRKEFPLHAYAAPLAKGNAIPPLAYEQEGYSDRLYRSGNAVTAYTPTRLSAYLATELHHYAPTPLQSYTQSIQQGNQQNKGVPETAPRWIASCYYSPHPQDPQTSPNPSYSSIPPDIPIALYPLWGYTCNQQQDAGLTRKPNRGERND